MTFNYSAAIRGVAAEMGRAPTPEQVDDLDDALRSIVHQDEAGDFIATAGDRQMSIVSYLRMVAGNFAKATTDSSSTAASRSQTDIDADAGILRVGGGVQHGRPRGDGFADIVRGFQAQHDAALAREAATWRNPWVAGQINRTRQVVLQKLDPAQAAKFKAEAGIA